jgi:outer membrane lipoprotein-sorting protein
MSPSRYTLFLFASFLACSTASPQQSPPASPPPPPQRDPQAVAALLQVVSAAGWGPTAHPGAIMASGTLTRFNGNQQQTESFTLKQRGPTQHRMELQDGGVTSTTVVNGLAGTIVFSDGKKHRLPAHAAISIQSPAFPFLSDLARAGDSDVEVRDLGSDSIDGVPCHGVSVARHAKSNDPLAHFRDLAAPLKVWISQQSGLPVRIDFIRLADDNPHVVIHFSRSFSDYRMVNGIAFPFKQEERFEGQLMYQFQFANVQFNAAVTDADFDLPKL